MERQAAGLTGLLSLALMFSLPFIIPHHVGPSTNFYNEWTALVFGLAGIASLAVCGRGAVGIPLATILPLGLAILLLPQWLAGKISYPSQAGLASLYLFWGAALMQATRKLHAGFAPEKTGLVLASAILCASLLNFASAHFQYWNMTQQVPAVISPYQGGGAYGNLMQPNHLANLLALGLCSTLYLYFAHRLRGIFALAITALMLLGMAYSGSRGPWLYLVALLFMSLLIRHWHPDQRTRRMVLGVLLAIPAYLLLQILLMNAGTGTSALERMHSANPFEIRWTLWRAAFLMWLQSPLMGVGYHGFSWEIFSRGAGQAYGTDSLTGVPYDHAHNILAQLAAEFGIGGMLLVGFAGWLAWRNVRRPMSAEKWWAWTSLSVMAIHSLLEAPLWYAYFWGPTAVWLALGDDTKTTLRLGWLQQPVVLAGILTGAAVLAAQWQTYPHLATLYRHYPEHLSAETLKKLYPHLESVSANTLFVPQLEAYYGMIPLNLVDPKLLPTLAEWNGRASHHLATAPLVYRQALFQCISGSTGNASKILKNAVQVYPSYLPHFRYVLANNQSIPFQCRHMAE